MRSSYRIRPSIRYICNWMNRPKLVSPVTTWVVAVEAKVRGAWATPPTMGVTTYPVSGEPPVEVGAVHLTVAAVLRPVAVTLVGAPGVVAGVTAFDAADCGPVPTAFVAATLKVYVVPLVRPVITWVVAVDAKVRLGWATPPM